MSCKTNKSNRDHENTTLFDNLIMLDGLIVWAKAQYDKWAINEWVGESGVPHRSFSAVCGFQKKMLLVGLKGIESMSGQNGSGIKPRLTKSGK